MIIDGSNDARTDQINKADGDRMNDAEKHTTTSMVLIEKKVPLSLHRFKDFNAPVPNL